MIYIYDILLNWFQENLMVDFFEWELDDELEHMKKIPLLKVETSFIQTLYYAKVRVDKSLLDKIFEKSESYFHNNVEAISYATLVSDGKKCFAVEFDEQGTLLYKSTLLLDEEEEVLEMCEELTLFPFTYEVLTAEEQREYLTRKEKENKRYLLKELTKMWQQKEQAKIAYLYDEYFSDDHLSVSTKYQILKEKVMIGYSSLHEDLLKILRLVSPQ